MKIALLSTITYPSSMANRIHLLAMTKYFALAGCKVDFFCKEIVGYEFHSNVTVKPDATNRSITTAWRFSKQLSKEPYDMWFIREPHLLLLCLFFYVLRNWKRPPKVCYEVHDMPRDWGDLLTLKALRLLNDYLVIVITKNLARDIVACSGITAANVHVLPDGFDPEIFNDSLPKTDAREMVRYTSDKPLIVYTGKCYDWKGVPTIVEAAKMTPEWNFYIVGNTDGMKEGFDAMVEEITNLHIVPYVPQSELIAYMRAADVLLLPNSATYKMSELYTSPLKMFEYMATNVPIVASNLPSIAEILVDEHNAFLTTPDNTTALARRIADTLGGANAQTIAQTAHSDVQQYSWQKRVERIINLVN